MRFHLPLLRTACIRFFRFRIGCVFISAVILSLTSFAAASAASGTFIVVNTTGDAVDPADFACSLREAIIASNTSTASGSVAGECAAGVAGQTNTIIFNISGSGVKTVTIGATDLPAITQPVVIDGTTQPGATCAAWPPALKVELRGPGWTGWPSTASPDTPPNLRTGLTVSAAGSTIRGLIVTKWDYGIFLAANNNKITCNYIGINSTGTAAVPNNIGLTENAGTSGNLIGGTEARDRNLISGNLLSGITISGTGTSVQGNYFGTDVSGASAVGNGLASQTGSTPPFSAVMVSGSADLIGGSAAGAGNLISGNKGGVLVDTGTNATVQGNLIGLNAAGSAALPNLVGLYIAKQSTDTVSNNVISGNSSVGVVVHYLLAGSGDPAITGNKIGTDTTGANAIPNGSGALGDAGILVVSPGSLVNNNLIVSGAGSGPGLYVTTGTTASNQLGSSQNNCLLGSSVKLAYDSASTPLTFTNNWWGAASAPSVGIDIGGSGQAMVTYAPYLTTPPAACPPAMSIWPVSRSFGSQAANTTSSPVTFTLTNFGAADMHPGTPTSGSGDFVVSSDTCTGATVPPYGTCTFAITFNPSTAGAKWGSVSISSDAAGSPATVGLAGTGIAAGLGATITVNTTSDATSSTDGVCSLREAITAANANTASGIVTGECAAGDSTNADTIAFAVGSGAQTIQPTSELPGITSVMVIDGTTQPGFAGTPIIQLDGSLAGGLVSGLTVNAPGGATIRGLVINRFDGNGIQLMSNGNKVVGSYIGTDVSGTTAPGNGQSGIFINATANNIIGTGAAGDGNLISGNGTHMVGANQGEGIYINGGSGNVIRGNTIGTNHAGSAALGNQHGGIAVIAGSGTGFVSNTTIGGSNPGEGNLISGNVNVGVIAIETTGTVIKGNKIGTSAAGAAALGNTGGGIVLMVADLNAVVGGTIPADRNIISGNTGYGIDISGLQPAGGTSFTVQGNYLGADATGASTLGNSQGGIRLSGAIGGTIGGTAAGAGNLIVANGGAGISAPDPAGTAGVSTAFQGNSIYGNTGLGIDLATTGVTANDTNDVDTGPNAIQNFPVLTSAASTGSSITVSGTLNSTASKPFRIEFFSNPSCDASGNGEGQTYLGSTSVTTDSSSNASFTTNLTASVPVGQAITATATYTSATTPYTSEFSACRTVTGLPAASLSAASHDFGSVTLGQPSSAFTFTLTNTGTAPLHVTNINATGDFAVVGTPCTSAITSSCTIDVTFHPTAEGSRTGTLSVTSDGSVSPLTADLSGTGIMGTPIAGLSPSSGHDFGSLEVGQTSSAFTFTLTNTGTAPLHVTNISASGDFAVVGSPCTGAITSSCTIDVTFHPTAEGSRTGTLSVTSDGSASPLTADLSGTAPQPGPTFTVNTTADSNNICDVAPGDCSLREAINAANAHTGADTINFNISGSGVQTIAIGSTGLPVITGPVTIDGTSQTGASCATWPPTLTIQVSGPGGSGAPDGLSITGGSSTVRGLVLNGFRRAIDLSTAGSNTISCNLIGTDAAGTSQSANSTGIWLTGSTNNVIGGLTPADRNLLSGNMVYQIVFNTGADLNTVEGNYIGTTASGGAPICTDAACQAALAIALQGGDSNLIGGPASGARNVISGNGGAAVGVTGDHNRLENNYIGTDPTGLSVVGNRGDAITVVSPASDTQIIDNLISGNWGVGIVLNTGSSDTTQITGNKIGVDATGRTALYDPAEPAPPSGSITVYIGGIALNNTTGTQITDNVIAYQNWFAPLTNPIQFGVALQSSAPGSVSDNCIFGNSNGVYNRTTTDADFSHTWWGTDTGPSGSDISGDGAANITTTPFLTVAPAACAWMSPVAGLAPASHDFGSLTVGQTSGAFSFTLSNTGGSPLHVTNVSASGDFAVVGSPCTGAISGSCTIDVTFHPTAAGSRSGTLSVTSDGSASPLSADLSGTGAAAPSRVPPLPTSPKNGAAVYRTPVKLAWKALKNISSYHVELATDDQFVNKISLPDADPVKASTLTGPLALGTYYWHVAVVDGSGQSEYSSTFSFDVTLSKSPKKNAQVTAHLPKFSWQAVKSATRYHLQVFKDLNDCQAGTDVHFETDALKAGYTMANPPDTPLDFGTYYWRVRVEQPAAGDYTPCWHFDVSTLKSPKSGALLTMFLPKFSWVANKLATSYQINFYSVPDGGSPDFLFSRQPIVPAYPAVADDGFTYGHYQWNIQENLGSGFGPSTPGFDLYITIMSKPANNTFTLDSTPTFSWKAIKGETDYHLEIATDAHFGSILHTYDALTRTTYTVPNTDALPQGGYYWRVVATGVGYTMPGWFFTVGP